MSNVLWEIKYKNEINNLQKKNFLKHDLSNGWMFFMTKINGNIS